MLFDPHLFHDALLNIKPLHFHSLDPNDPQTKPACKKFNEQSNLAGLQLTGLSTVYILKKTAFGEIKIDIGTSCQ